ncbi:helix-turn-helix transcriptional regulator [Diaphorobacter sp.]|uniref:helix-turn-helix domain-containing protein n=1 Tax=Diaphorobacter sp. TaxID=1934310 RepID=UPI00258CB770|nr:helix-turn-helix transcriptional regulator [Diaphorobacter sp.]
MTPDYRTRLNPVLRAIAQVPRAAWCSKPDAETTDEEIPMTDDVAETEAPNPVHSTWLADVLLAEDCPPPAPVTFPSEPKRDQAALVRTIGNRLREARELCNLSQSEAARHFGYANPSKLSKVELATDTNSVPLWLIARAAKLYEVSVDFLFGATDDWEIGAVRGVQGFMLDAWERARQRDLASLELLHAEIAAVSTHVTALAASACEVAEGLSTYRARNPLFDEAPASAMLASRIERHAERAHAAEVALKRFHQNLRPGAAIPKGA